MSDMRVTIAGVELKNPIIAASGTFGYGMEYNEFYPVSHLGGISCKGTTLKERQGNPPSRIAETPAGMLNSVGLQNPGVDQFLSVYLPWLLQQDTVVIANMAGSTLEDYAAMAERLDASDVHMVELNISCPNVKKGGASFGTSCKPAAIQFFFRLAGPQKVPFSIYPNLDPGMVIVAVRPTRRVYLTCCKPDTAQCRHRKGGFFSAASFSAPVHRHRPRRSVIRHFIRCMLCAPVVDLYRCLIFVQSYNSVF